MEKRNSSGHCLCGKVKVQVSHSQSSAAPTSVGVCHCGMCRRWGGGPFFAMDCGSDVTWEGAQFISTYNSSSWAERGFCNQCGTHLFYRLKEGNRHILPAGLFTNLENVIFDHEIFIEGKPSFYEFKNQTKKMTGAEVFASATKKA